MEDRYGSATTLIWLVPEGLGIMRLLPVAAPRQVADKLQLPPNALALYIVQTDYSSADEPLVYSSEYHLPDAFDFVAWRRGPTRRRTTSNDGAS